MHETIWHKRAIPLLDMLNSMIGPIFMFVASQARLVEDWQESLHLHEPLVETILARNAQAAHRSIEAHLRHSLDLALKSFR